MVMFGCNWDIFVIKYKYIKYGKVEAMAIFKGISFSAETILVRLVILQRRSWRRLNALHASDHFCRFYNLSKRVWVTVWPRPAVDTLMVFLILFFF